MLPGPAKEESRKLGRGDIRYVRRIPAKLSRREKERERRGRGGGRAERTRRLLENERSKYGTGTYVYISRRRSAGGATGASKNVLRTLDITGSNVTRSRREPRVCLSRSGEERSEGGETRTAAVAHGTPDDTVSRLLTITIDLALFYARVVYYSNLFKSMPPRAIGRKGRPSIGGMARGYVIRTHAEPGGRSTTIKRIGISDDKRM